MLYDTSIKWRGKVYSGTVAEHDPERVSHLGNMRLPGIAAELMQFLQALKWMRTSLMRIAEVVQPRWGLLE